MGEITEEDAWEEDNLYECVDCEDMERQRDQLNKRISELEEMRDRIVDFLIKNETEKESITLKGILFIINDDYQKTEKRKK